MADPKLDYKRYNPRSVSWQVASVLNPSLQYSLPASQQSKHAREKRERSDFAGAPGIKIVPASWKSWQEEEGLPLPPQYVSPGALCKAMPKYMRVKARPDQMRQAQNATTLTPTAANAANAATSDSPGYHPGNHHHLPFSPHVDVVVGSPRSEHSSAKLTPRSVLDSPKQHAMVASASAVAPPQQAIKLAANTGCSSASPARSPGHPSMTASVAAAAASEPTTPPVSAPHQNTPQTQATSSSRSCLPQSPSAPRRHSGAQSPRIRSASTSPMHPCSVAAGGRAPSSRGQVVDPTSLQSKLNSTIAQHPELLQREVPQMQPAAQGSPLSPANSSLGRESCNHKHHCNHHHHHSSACNYSSLPVALPPMPPISGRQHSQQRRTRNAHPQEPTLETYQKISPNTYATNTVWNDRRDQDSRDRDQTQPRRTILIKSN